MDIELPEDVLYLICDHTRRLPEGSSATLFNLAVSSKRLAPLALASLYRHARSPGAYDEFEAAGLAEADELVSKWAIMWHSIYEATAQRALYPYHTYLRFLDLRDLENLIGDHKFRGKIEQFFFKPLAPLKPSKGRLLPLQVLEILEQFGDGEGSSIFTKRRTKSFTAIVRQNSLIEGISGRFRAEALQRWLPSLPRMSDFEPYDGAVLEDDSTRQAIHKNCPNLRNLILYNWTGLVGDTYLGPFISDLPKQSLNSLVGHSSCGASVNTAIALNSHNERLKRLHLVMEPNAVLALGLFEPFTSLTQLHLEFTHNTDLAVVDEELLVAFAKWLEGCKLLKEVTLINITSATTALVPMLSDETVRLESLSIITVNVPMLIEANDVFFQSLAQQKSLKELDLRADGEDATMGQIVSFISAVSQLTDLRSLELRGLLMENFEEEHITSLLMSLPQLEAVYVGGYYVTDAVLQTVATMKRLKRINLAALSRFSLDALLELIENLDAFGNDGLQISIDNADPEHVLTAEMQELVRAALKDKVNGTLDYVPYREAEDFNSEDFSD